MKGRWHLIAGTAVFVPLWLLLEPVRLTLIFVPIALSVYPDVDRNFVPHRNWLSHSIIPWAVVLAFNFDVEHALWTLSIGIHCLLDVRIEKKKMVGFYTIKPFFGGRGMSGTASTAWLLANFAASVALFGFTLAVRWV